MQLLRELPVEVTARDIELGVPGNQVYCAIARAIARQYPGATYYGVAMLHLTMRWHLEMRSEGWAVTYQLPGEACRFIKRFDRQNWLRWLFPPRPFTFVARLADEPWRVAVGHEVVPEPELEPVG